jgi:hypothetical protein
VLGVHYSATIWRWYLNWLSNKDAIVAKYGDKWFRTWAFFLAWSTIASRWVPFFVLGIHQLFYAMSSQGTAAVFQITMHKNLNAYHRMLGAANHGGIHVKLNKEPEYIPTFIHCREKLIYLPG